MQGLAFFGLLTQPTTTPPKSRSFLPCCRLPSAGGIAHYTLLAQGCSKISANRVKYLRLQGVIFLFFFGATFFFFEFPPLCFFVCPAVLSARRPGWLWLKMRAGLNKTFCVIFIKGFIICFRVFATFRKSPFPASGMGKFSRTSTFSVWNFDL